MFKPSNKKDLLFNDFTTFIEGDLGKTEWVTVFEFFEGKYDSVDRGTFFSAIIPENQKQKVLEKVDWDLLIGHGRPGFITSYSKGKEESKYYRLGDDDNIEPLIHWRSFRNHENAVIEISEEFRHYFDLFEINRDGERVFIYTNDDGDEDDVAVINDNRVDIKLKYLKEFLAAKKMYLAIYFEAMRFLPETLEEADIPHTNSVKKEDDYTYSLCVRNLSLGKNNCQGWLLGKKLISGAKDFSFSFWGSKEDERFEEFIIGVDEEGKEIVASCNADYQSKPGLLTPIFFRREILKKYYDSPDIFSVEDGYLRREGFWGLRMMNNHRDHVVAWLGDLKLLPYKEQTHWRAFNLTPGDRKISHTDFTRNIEGNFSDSEHPELYFKQKLESFRKAWHKKFGWHLFHELSSEDIHHLKSLHIPTTNSQKEFDDQIASIAKIFIDSLNGKALANGLTIEKQNPGSIDKFEAFLISQRLSFPQMISFLKNLQALRSTGIAHRKGDNYEKVKIFFDIDKKDFPTVFDDILIKCIWVLNTLENSLFKKDTEEVE